MSFTVRKMEWEYGAQYGHVYVPTSIDDFKQKLSDLHTHALHKAYPFYIHIYFTNNTFIGVIVGLDTSGLDFGELFLAGDGEQRDRYKMDSADGTIEATAPIHYYYGGAYSEKEPEALLSRETVFDALFFYTKHLTFPSSIKLYRPEFKAKYEAYRRNNG